MTGSGKGEGAGQVRRKLIEVALPLEAINKESAREKSIRHGHPSTLHLWWARRPLAACRAVLFASLVDDPSSLPEEFPTEEAQEAERQRLFRILEDLVKWENSSNETILEKARAEIRRSCGGKPPPVLDPFCGGGSIPLEAQRLGLEAHASDLNPVAVLITKALIEIPPKFAGRPPIHPGRPKEIVDEDWKGARGLAEDVRYYGEWMRNEAEKRIGHLYPKVKLPKEHGGAEATVIAWLWARTVQCPNPACGARMPLVRSFWLSTKKGKKAWVEPVVEPKKKTVRFAVKTGEGEASEGTVNRRGATCIACRTAVPFDHVRAEGKAGRMGAQLMTIVGEGKKGRIYLPPTEEHEAIAAKADPHGVPDTDLPEQALGFRVQLYGMTKHRDLFTPRQLVALTTFSDLVSEARERILRDAAFAGLTAYANALATYLAFGIDKNTLTNCTQATWQTNPDRLTQAFSRQALPMTWDFAEANPLSEAGGGFVLTLQSLAEVMWKLPHKGIVGQITQTDAVILNQAAKSALISTDPPYYDNIGYADLADFFYVWLRRSLGKIYPEIFNTLLVPKSQELVASPYRFGGDRQKAEQFFEEGLARAFERLREKQNPKFPLTVYYAFKQSETEDEGDPNKNSPVSSTGWETMLEGLLKAGFSISGTWPMRTELIGNLKRNVGALASSIVIVCRPRPENAPIASRREFLTALKKELPPALKNLQHGNIAPVDLAQASIGPGMAIFSRYSKVLEADGSPLTVRTALQIINQELDSYLSEQEGEMDRESRFCLAWFSEFGMDDGPYGTAEVLAKAKNTSLGGLVEAGVLKSKAGKVGLLRREELPQDWDPATDPRLTVWETTQHLIRALEKDGKPGAAAIHRKLGSRADAARDLSYRLYGICERKKWAQEALAYNSLVIAWPEVARISGAAPLNQRQTKVFE